MSEIRLAQVPLRLWARVGRWFRQRSAGAQASEVAGRFDAVREGAGGVVTIRPWECRLPRLVVLEIARSRGFAPVGGDGALVEQGHWRQPMSFEIPGDVR